MPKKKDKTQLDLVGRIPIARPTVKFETKKAYKRKKNFDTLSKEFEID